MKKTIVLLAVLAGFFGMQAQNTITNGDFELWSYGKPVNWTVGLHGNITSIIPIPVEVNFGTQSNDAHSGNSAIQLTSADVTIPIVGYSFNLPGILQAGESDGFSIPLEDILTLIQIFSDTTGGSIGDLDSIDLASLSSLMQLLSKGVPCSTIPGAVSAWVKYQAQNNDQMMMIAVAKKNGAPVDYAYKTFGDLNPSAYQEVGINFESAGEPCDSIMIVLLSAVGLNSTSVLLVDDIALHFGGVGIVSIEDFEGDVYPNPASDMLHIRPGNGNAFRWTLTDISGKVLQTGEATGETTVDTRSCAPGLYLLQVNANGKTGVSKVVIR